MGAMLVAVPGPTRAQIAVPPSNGPCVVSGTTVTCTGDVSPGIIAFGIGIDTLNVNSLTADITPANGISGIQFTSPGNVTITSDTGAFQISTNGNNAFGVFGYSAFAGSVSITHSGDVTTTGDSAYGVFGYTSGTGTVTVSSTGDIATSGDFAYGVFGYAGGTGTVTITHTGDITTTGFNAIGIYGLTAENAVSITHTGNVTTSGRFAYGIHGYSSDSTVTIDHTGIIITTGDNADGIYGYADEDDSVTITHTGRISTEGDDAYGISGYSDGGGITIINTGPISTRGEDAYGISAFTTGAAPISITNNGPITTTGEFADGIIAISTGGDITINHTGDITTTGNGSDAIDANNPVGVGSTTITISAGSTLTGGTNSGDGIDIADGLNNRVINFGTITTLGENAIEGTTGNETVENFGTVTGNIDLGAGTNTFNNRSGGLFNSGEIVIVGAGNAVNNAGRLSPGGIGTQRTTAITGNLVQTSTGEFQVDVDVTAATADLVTVTGTANLSGTVVPTFTNLSRGARSVTILSAAGGTTNSGLGLTPSTPVFQTFLSFPNPNDVVLNYSIDFVPEGLNRNQTRIAATLNSAFDNGLGALGPMLLALLNGVPTIEGYRNALDQLSPEIYLNTEIASLFAAEDFIENLFACPRTGEGFSALSEGECIWARPRGRIFDRDSDAEIIGFNERNRQIAAGVQFSVAPNWFAGFALGYERGSLTNDIGAKSDSDRYHAGAAVKYQNGPILVAAALSGGIADYDTRRTMGFGGFSGATQSEHSITNIAGQTRLAYILEYKSWFAKPLVDLNLTHLSREAVSETGTAAVNLFVESGSETVFSVTPGIEVGGDFRLFEGLTVRPYGKVGVSYFPDAANALTAQFVNAPTGTIPFQIKSNFENVFADVAAGATAFLDNGASFGVSYEGLISGDTRQHGVTVKATIPLDLFMR